MTVGLPPGRGGRAVRCIDGVPAMNHKNTGGTIMSALNELIEQIENPELRKRIADEVNKLAKQKKFGLVFEEHQPECTLLYDVPVRKGAKVTLRDAKNITDIYTVLKLENGKALCLKEGAGEAVEFTADSLVTVAGFGEPIYPCLKPVDSICNAPDSDLWHTLIEADNYHALQLLEYLYAGKVDCIYIDPPYNTGARDWKYNNDYVDSSDQYRHSKWLSMMQKRLKLAKKLLNPAESVLIVTIDEKEYLHLGCLLEEMFPEANMQMVSSCIMPGGVSRGNEFGRSDEYIYFVKLGAATPVALQLSDEWLGGVKNTSRSKVHWEGLLRTGTNNMRSDRPNLFYPVLVSEDGKKFLGVGNPLKITDDRHLYVPPEGSVAIFPIHTDQTEGCWRISHEKLLELYNRHVVRLGGFTPRGMAINYLKQGEYAKVLNGIYKIKGIKEDNSYDLDDADYRPSFIPSTQWTISSHDASRHGSGMLRKIFGDKTFSFPKSLYAVHDAIRFFVANKPNALIVDFFAGSGTTLHAVNLLNAEDGGHRRCILVTNNEVSEAEKNEFEARGIKPGDPEWEEKGIAHYVTWPRTVCSIKGENIKGEPLKGNYIGSDIPMSDGFKANAAFFKLGFLDKTKISLGMQFREMLPTLWMKSGAHGTCPTVDGNYIPKMLILPQNKMAILNDENCFAAFADELSKYPEIGSVYLVTDYEGSFVSMINDLPGRTTYQLYRDYLDNFRINTGRNAR